MRVFAALIAAIALAAPALAQSGWRGDIERGFTGPVFIGSITIGEELAEDDEDYGAREFERLIADLHDEVASQLAQSGRFAAEQVTGAARLDRARRTARTPERGCAVGSGRARRGRRGVDGRQRCPPRRPGVHRSQPAA